MKFFYILFMFFVVSTFGKDIAFTQNESVLKELIQLSEVSTISSMEILEERVIGVKNLFADIDNRSGVIDPRGAFPTIYQVTTTQGLKDILASEAGNGPFDDPSTMRCFTVEFGKLYLENLHEHLTGGTPSEGWQVYYEKAQTDASIIEILATGVNVHVNLDLTQSLLNCEAPLTFKDDFMRGGETLVDEIPQMSEDLFTIYNVDKEFTEGFFKMFLLGEFGDYIFEALGMEETTSYALFQTLRFICFHYHSSIMNSRDPSWYSIFAKTTEPRIRLQMYASWKASDFLLQEVIFSLKEHGFDYTYRHIQDLIFKSIFRIDFDFDWFSNKIDSDDEQQDEASFGFDDLNLSSE
ncbi:DUF5995 family protein [bacterium]|nr:DUF5995 family protein [bacterium]